MPNTDNALSFQTDVLGEITAINYNMGKDLGTLSILPLSLHGQVLQLGYSQDGKRDFIKLYDFLLWLVEDVLSDKPKTPENTILRDVIKSYDGLAEYILDIHCYTFCCSIFNVRGLEDTHTKRLLGLIISFLVESYKKQLNK